MKKIILFIFIIYSLPSLGSAFIRLKVIDEFSAPLSYCDVFVANKFHLLTDDTGNVRFGASLCEAGDTIWICYLGYEPYKISVSPQFLEDMGQTCQLIPKSYMLDDVVVKGTFDAVKFFKEKKKSMLLPYLDKHTLLVSAKLNYIDEKGKTQNVSGNLKVLFRLKEIEIIENNCTQDTLLQACIKRAIQLASYIPSSFCIQKVRKMYDTNYLGMKDNQWNFVFDINPRYIDHPFFGFAKGDVSPTHLTVNQQGFISSIETHTIIKSGKSRSYNLYADYVEYKSQMAPVYINATLIEDKMNIELWCEYNK